MEWEQRWAGGQGRTRRLSLGEAPGPAEPAAKLTRLTQPLLGMGGRGRAPGQWEEPTGVGWGQGRESPGWGRKEVGQELPTKKAAPSPSHRAGPSRGVPRDGHHGERVSERKTMPRLDKGKLRFIERLLCARRCARRFTYIIALSPHNNPAR